MSKAPNNQSGALGEGIALQFLKNCGFEILHVNWRHKHWEVDVIMKDEGVLVFVEVKTRVSMLFGRPEQFVDRKKERNLIKAANNFIAQVRHEGDIRFDIVAIHLTEPVDIEHIKDAFWDY